MAGSAAGSSRDGCTPARHTSDGSRRATVRGPGQLRYTLPWLAILFIASAFHFYRGVPVDGWIFLAAGLLMSADTARNQLRQDRDPAPGAPAVPAHLAPADVGRTRQAGRRMVWTMLVVGTAAAVVVVLAPPDSFGFPAVVGLVGAAMLVVAWPQRRLPDGLPAADPARVAAGHTPQRPGDPRPRAAKPLRRAAWWWAAVLLFLALWELGNYFIDMFDPAGAWEYPPLTDLLQPLFDNDASRWLMMLAWLAGCAGLLRSAVKP